MATNFLNYAKISYDEIVSQINDKLKADDRFANFRESSIAQMMVEIFSATVELMTHHIERRAEETFFDTAQLRSSVISLSRQLGYSIQRPIPAQASIQITVKGDISSNLGDNGSALQIPLQSIFSYTDLNFFNDSTITINITEDLINEMAQQGDSFSHTFTVDYISNKLNIVEGTITDFTIDGVSNVLVGQKFQQYKIEDTTFSNIYGADDFNNKVTRVWVGTNKDTEYAIDKRSLINWQLTSNVLTSGAQNTCLVRTSNTEGIDILFGDGGFAQIGAKTQADNITIQYLSTKGSKGNRAGIIGEKLTFNGTVLTPNGTDVTNNLTFNFLSNPVGGADMESINSIRMNAPAIYYTLDRLVTAKDYSNFLKTLSSPITIKNAIAWGEQEEINFQKPIDAINKMFNIVLFTCLGSMYQTDVSPFFPKEQGTGIEDVVLDANFNEDDITIRSYFNVYVRQDIVDQLKDYASSGVYNSILGVETAYLVNLSEIDALSADFGPTATLNFIYGSDTYDSSIVISSSVDIDLTNTGSDVYSDVASALTNIASRITAQLQTTIDTRGLIGTNGNINLPALPNVVCYYNNDGIHNTLNISGTLVDPCFIKEFTGDFAPVIGLTSNRSDKLITTFSEPIAQNIITVIDDLQKRSEVTVNDIYVSPIIQKFLLSGTVYVNQLYDLSVIKNQVNDAIYSFLDTGADFNTPIYISNIVQIIENIKGVNYSEVSFSSDFTKYTGTNGSCYGDMTNILNAWGVKGVTDILNENIDNVFKLTEREFYRQVKITYDFLINSGGDNSISFANSFDFIKTISALHKDYVYYIREQLINTTGDIGQSQLDVDGITPIHNYTLGSEIARVKSVLTFQYKV